LTICSMTGYAIINHETAAGTITVELKSVNSRFLDLQFRINDELRSVEHTLREAIMRRIVRGKVECRVSLSRKGMPTPAPMLNTAVLASLSGLQTEIQHYFKDAAGLSVNELLRWPGMITENEVAYDTLHSDIAATMNDTLHAFIESRIREGNALKAILLSRVDDMEAIVRHITPMIPQVIAQFQQKAIARLQETLGLALQDGGSSILSREEAADRIRQEVTLYGIRIDVAEELARLSTHLTETRHILEKGGQVGKRLDFMMQELNRETNTLGSKATVKELADASMTLKLLIEQMREQVQNLE
jgi:uncharacterized protein (TIGR00255 family)